MAIDAPTAPRSPTQRRWMIAGGVLLAYAAFAGAAQLIGEDRPDQAELARLDAFCTALYSDYPGALYMLAEAGVGLGGPGGLAESFLVDFIDADLAPDEFRDDVAYLAEGIDRGLAGDLRFEDVDPYVVAYEDLRDRAEPTCDDAGRQVQIEDLSGFDG